MSIMGPRDRTSWGGPLPEPRLTGTEAAALDKKERVVHVDINNLLHAIGDLKGRAKHEEARLSAAFKRIRSLESSGRLCLADRHVLKERIDALERRACVKTGGTE